jgi:hypothetical protein
MKKLLFVLLLIIPAFVINAQDVEPKEELASVQVIDHIYDKTTEVISELAQALAVPAEHVYNVLVKQQVVEGVSLLVGLLFSILFTSISWFILFKKHNFKLKWYLQNIEGYWMISVILSIVSIILFVVFLSSGISSLLNPEYGAIRDIISIL